MRANNNNNEDHRKVKEFGTACGRILPIGRRSSMWKNIHLKMNDKEKIRNPRPTSPLL